MRHRRPATAVPRIAGLPRHRYPVPRQLVAIAQQTAAWRWVQHVKCAMRPAAGGQNTKGQGAASAAVLACVLLQSPTLPRGKQGSMSQ